MPSARFEVGQTVQTWDRQEQLWQEASIVEADAGDGMVKVQPTPTKRSRRRKVKDAAPFYLNSRASKNIRRMPAGNERPVRKREPPPLSSEWSFASNYSDLREEKHGWRKVQSSFSDHIILPGQLGSSPPASPEAAVLEKLFGARATSPPPSHELRKAKVTGKLRTRAILTRAREKMEPGARFRRPPPMLSDDDEAEQDDQGEEAEPEPEPEPEPETEPEQPESPGATDEQEEEQEQEEVEEEEVETLVLDDPDRVDYHLCEKTKEIAPAISAFSEKLRASKEEDDSPTKSPKRWRRSASRQAALDAANARPWSPVAPITSPCSFPACRLPACRAIWARREVMNTAQVGTRVEWKKEKGGLWCDGFVTSLSPLKVSSSVAGWQKFGAACTSEQPEQVQLYTRPPDLLKSTSDHLVCVDTTDVGGQFHRHAYAAHATDGAKKKVLTSPWSPWAFNGGLIKMNPGKKIKMAKGRSTRAMGREERDHWSEDTVKRNLKQGLPLPPHGLREVVDLPPRKAKPPGEQT